MRIILYIIQKEFLQVFRNRIMKAMIFIVPFLQLLILVNAATFDLKNIKMFIIDKDLSGTSRKLTAKFSGSDFFEITGSSFSVKEGEEYINNNKADVVLHIPADFEKKLVRNNKAKVQFLINAIDGTTAGLINAYTQNVIMDYNQQVMAEWFDIASLDKMQQIDFNYSHWYNPHLDYKAFMVPGILVLLVTMIGLFLTSMNTVKEREIGTIEQINVSPIKRYQLIAGKLIPFLIIALFELAFGLALGKLIFDIPLTGSLWLVFAFAFVYLLAVLGIGLFISTVTNTQQQAMLFSMFFMFIFILMSGLFTPVESMPKWAQWLNVTNPVAYFIKVIRMVLLKGSEFINISGEFVSMGIYGIIALSLAVWRYRKTT